MVNLLEQPYARSLIHCDVPVNPEEGAVRKGWRILESATPNSTDPDTSVLSSLLIQGSFADFVLGCLF